MERRGCASAMGMIKFPSSCSSPKALCNQFIDYYICSRGVFCINHIKLRNFVVITIECSIATVDRGSIMTRIYRWSMMVYSSLQAEFMVTKQWYIMWGINRWTMNPPHTGKVMPKTFPSQYCNSLWCYNWCITRLILGFRPANERRRYKVTPSLIGWAQT